MYNGWWPQLVVSNGVGDVSLTGVSLRVEPDGRMVYLQEFSSEVKSPMSLRRFPFDRQKLEVIFEPLGFYASELRLAIGSGTTDLPERPLPISGWELLDLDAETKLNHDASTGKDYSLFVVALEMRRHPEATIWGMIVPLLLIVLLSTVVFWMDRESLGSRMDISFIGLLTVVAFQAFTMGNLPDISYFVLIDGVIYAAYLAMAACILSNIWVDNLNRRGELEAADRFDWHGRWVLPSGFLLSVVGSGVYFFFA